LVDGGVSVSFLMYETIGTKLEELYSKEMARIERKLFPCRKGMRTKTMRGEFPKCMVTENLIENLMDFNNTVRPYFWELMVKAFQKRNPEIVMELYLTYFNNKE